jgi:hypothetical protein
MERLSQASKGIGSVFGHTNVPLIHLAQARAQIHAQEDDLAHGYAEGNGESEYDPYHPDNVYQPEYDDYHSSEGTPISVRSRLTTITEKTEQRTVDTAMFASPSPSLSASDAARSPGLNSYRPPSELLSPPLWQSGLDFGRPMSTTTMSTSDYGEVIGTYIF